MLITATIILGLAILVTLGSLLLPSFANSKANKIIVVDTLTFQVLGLCILLSFHDKNPFGLLVAMLGFLSSIVLARFIDPPQS